MNCDVAREALSARIDAEAEPVPSARVDEHLRSCRWCADWYASAQQQAAVLHALADPPRTPWATGAGADTAPPRGGRVVGRYGLRAALALAGLIQIGLAGAQAAGMHFGMVAAHRGHATGAHLLNETTAWCAALGIVAIAAAFRPAITAGLACVLVAYVGLLGCYVVADALAGQVTAARVISHGPVAAAALLAVLAWRTDRRSPPPPHDQGTHDGQAWPPRVRALQRDERLGSSDDSAA